MSTRQQTMTPPTLKDLAQALAQGKATARGLAEQALDAIDRQTAAGVPAFIRVDSDSVLHDADASDLRRKAGQALSAFDGVPFAVKDLFDVAGEVTTAGSVVLAVEAPAKADAPTVAALEAHGMVVLGRTNMTEFAYSGVGLNPHYGTPPSVYDRATKRLPGGSSSGSAVAVADGVCAVALGTDTGGSCRIPAAFNGIVGFKPTASRISKQGVFPLSSTLDSIGPIGRSVSCCAIVDAMLAGGRVATPADGEAPALPLQGLRIGVLRSYVMEGLDDTVAADYARALKALAAAGVELVDVTWDELNGIPGLLRNGGILAYEANRLHAARLATQAEAYDPRVSTRILLAAQTDDSTYAALLQARAALIAQFAPKTKGLAALVCPTVPIVPPPIAALAQDDDYRRINLMALRNTTVFNLLDGCAGSIPMNRTGEAPTGLMLAAPAGQDRVLFSLMAAAEQALAAASSG